MSHVLPGPLVLSDEARRQPKLVRLDESAPVQGSTFSSMNALAIAPGQSPFRLLLGAESMWRRAMLKVLAIFLFDSPLLCRLIIVVLSISLTIFGSLRSNGPRLLRGWVNFQLPNPRRWISFKLPYAEQSLRGSGCSGNLRAMTDTASHWD